MDIPAVSDCLKGYIGVSNDPPEEGEEPEENSGLYLTSLPDISITTIAKVDPSNTSNSGEYDFATLMDKIESRTILKFRTLFIIEFNKCFRINKRETIECIICENKALLAVALWYLYGTEFMQERINSTRINRYTTIDKIKAQKLRNEYTDAFLDELSVAIQNIDVESSACIEHHVHQSGFISVVNTIP